MANLQQYYRSFSTLPYQNANYLKDNVLPRQEQTGGSINRFGATLSGNPNPKVFRGSPSGGAEGYLSKHRNPDFIGGPYNSNIYGSGLPNFKPRGKFYESDPRYWGPRGLGFNGQGRSRGASHSASPLMDAFINPRTLHSTGPIAGSRIY